MRAASIISLLIAAAFGAEVGGLMVSTYRDHHPPVQAQAAQMAQMLQVQAYDPAIPKAPAAGPRLDTLPPPAVAPAAPSVPAQAQAAAPPPPARPANAEAPAAAAPPPPRPRPAPRAYAQAGSAAGHYVEAPVAGAYAPGDQRAPEAPEPQGFRLDVSICRSAARQADPLADTPECQGILQAARAQQEACARAFVDGDDRLVMSRACRQAAMGR